MTDAIINVNGDSVQMLDIMLLTTVLTLLPSLVVLMTSFTRYVVVFSFLRTAMGTQQTPPNMVLVGMALILTLFTMTPTVNSVREEALDPYTAGEITQEEFFERAQGPLKDFMIRNTQLSVYADVHGHDYAAALHDLHALQDPALHPAGWLAAAVLVPGGRDTLGGKGAGERWILC